MIDFVEHAKCILRQALDKSKSPALLCSYGKDSVVLLHLLSQVAGDRKLRVIHADTTFEFPELYEHKRRLINLNSSWMIPVTLCNRKALESGMNYGNTTVFDLTCNLKTRPLNRYIRDKGIDFLITGIRRDEEGSRAKERYFSYRDKKGHYEPSDNQPEFYPLTGRNITDPGKGHYRVNALLDWTELDIWEYTRDCELPVCPLYFSRGGKRYRSLGCSPVTTPVESSAKNIDEIITEIGLTTIPERASRKLQDGERPYMMEELRRKGFC